MTIIDAEAGMVTAYILGGLLEDEVGCERVGVGGRAVEDQHPESRTDSFLFRSLCSAPSVPIPSVGVGCFQKARQGPKSSIRRLWQYSFII